MARKSKSGATGAAAPEAHATPLAKARLMREAGNVRRARAFAEEAASAGPEAERADARALLTEIAPDRGALLTAAGVLVLILVAAWIAILRAH